MNGLERRPPILTAQWAKLPKQPAQEFERWRHSAAHDGDARTYIKLEYLHIESARLKLFFQHFMVHDVTCRPQSLWRSWFSI